MKLRTVELGSEFTEKVLDHSEDSDFKLFYRSELYQILIQHDLIQKVVSNEKNTVTTKTIYSPAPCEWTLGMVIDAAMCILKIQEISRKCGYQLLDAHLHNVVFDGYRPLFVDFGSFKKTSKSDRWAASGEYRTEIKVPIEIISKGMGSIIRKSLEHNNQLSRDGLWRIRYPIMWKMVCSLKMQRWLIMQRERLALVGIYNLSNAILHASNSTIAQLRRKLPTGISDKKFMVYLVRAASKILGPLLEVRPAVEIKKLEKKRKLIRKNYWTDYYSVLENSATEEDLDRFNLISEKIKNLGIKSVTDLGGNNGLFIRRLLVDGIIDDGKVIDADEGAIESGRSLLKDLTGKYVLGLVDLSEPLRPKNWLENRFISECAVALAITHHLTLRYRLTFEEIIAMISRYCEKYIFVEFMPMGLWNGSSAPEIPEWYSEVQFIVGFEAHFRLIERVTLRQNRILFIGEKITDH